MSGTYNLFGDSKLKNSIGYAYSDKDPESSYIRYPGELFKKDGTVPSFRITHWWTNFPIEDFTPQNLSEGVWKTSTNGINVILEEGDEFNTITLDILGKNEYGEKVRKDGGGFPHLLLEQFFGDSPSIGQLKSFNFNCDLKIEKVINYMNKKDYDPLYHTAQTSAIFAIENRNKESDSYGEYFWFGVPVYDDRVEIPLAYTNRDGGKLSDEKIGTGMFIYTIDGKYFWDKSVLDNSWHSINKNLLPFIHKAFTCAQESGYLKGAVISDMHFKSFNFGWEITGTYDAAIKLRNIRGDYSI